MTRLAASIYYCTDGELSTRGLSDRQQIRAIWWMAIASLVCSAIKKGSQIPWEAVIIVVWFF